MSDDQAKREPYEEQMLEKALEEKLGGASPGKLDPAELEQKAHAPISPAPSAAAQLPRWAPASLAALVWAGLWSFSA